MITEQDTAFIKTMKQTCTLAGWKYIPPDEERRVNQFGQIEIEHGYRLYFQNSSERGKIHVSVSHWENGIETRGENLTRFRHSYSDGPMASIKVSIEKTPNALMADLTRRMIEQGRKELETLRGRRTIEQNSKATAALQAAKLMQCWSALRDRNAGDTDAHEHFLDMPFTPDQMGYGDGDIRVSSSSVEIHIRSMSHKVAARYVAFMKDLQEAIEKGEL